MNILAVGCLLVSVVLTVRATRRLRGTTLVMAGCWAILATTLWCLLAAIELTKSARSDGFVDLGYYSVAVLSLCPPIAVLGARRPRVWHWAVFVILPLIAVLMWPVASGYEDLQRGPLELETPTVLGIVVVLVMGAGNYFGTRYTLPIVLYAAAIILLVAPMSVSVPDVFSDRSQARVWAAVALLASIGLTTLRSLQHSGGRDSQERLWLSFVDCFGLVWAKRVMDRLNESAAHERWSCTVHWHGLVWTEAITAEERDRTAARVDETLRWLLKRFADESWIEDRLRTQSTTTSVGD